MKVYKFTPEAEAQLSALGINTADDIVAKLTAKPESAQGTAPVAPVEAPKVEATAPAPAIEDKTISDLKAQIAAITAAFEAFKSESTTKTNQAIATAAVEIAAATGTTPVSVSPTATKTTNRAELLNQFAEINDPKKRADFFKTHRSELLGHKE